jgi:hypothetical protein
MKLKYIFGNDQSPTLWALVNLLADEPGFAGQVSDLRERLGTLINEAGGLDDMAPESDAEMAEDLEHYRVPLRRGGWTVEPAIIQSRSLVKFQKLPEGEGYVAHGGRPPLAGAVSYLKKWCHEKG